MRSYSITTCLEWACGLHVQPSHVITDFIIIIDWFYWLICWLIFWVTGWLIDLTDLAIDWFCQLIDFIGWLFLMRDWFDWLIYWLCWLVPLMGLLIDFIKWLVYRLFDLIDWMIDWFYWLSDWFYWVIGWFIWLIDWWAAVLGSPEVYPEAPVPCQPVPCPQSSAAR